MQKVMIVNMVGRSSFSQQKNPPQTPRGFRASPPLLYTRVWVSRRFSSASLQLWATIVAYFCLAVWVVNGHSIKHLSAFKVFFKPRSIVVMVLTLVVPFPRPLPRSLNAPSPVCRWYRCYNKKLLTWLILMFSCCPWSLSFLICYNLQV